jgi:hypothetical protein
VLSLTAQTCYGSVGCSGHNKILYTGPTPYTLGGDSGGPFYLPSQGKAWMRGMHLGTVSVNDPDQMLAERWSSIASALSVTIVACGC